MKCGSCEHDERFHDEKTERCMYRDCRCVEFTRPDESRPPPDCTTTTETLPEQLLNNLFGISVVGEPNYTRHISINLEPFVPQGKYGARPKSGCPDSVESWLDSPSGKDWLKRYKRHE